MWISPAYAQSAAGGGDSFLAFLPLVLIFVVFYFLLIRPQQKKMKQRNQMLAEVRRGDRVMTGGGIFGTVTRVTDDNNLVVEIAEGVRVAVARSTVGDVLSKTGEAEARTGAKTGAKAGARTAARGGTGKGDGKGDGKADGRGKDDGKGDAGAAAGPKGLLDMLRGVRR